MAPFDYNRHLFLEETFVSPDSKNMTGIKLTRLINALQFIGRNMTVVDLGCGTGSFTSRIKQFYPLHHVIGIDISKSALDLAADKHPHLTFVRCGVTDLPFADMSVEAITGFDILEHLDDIDTTLKEVHRVLKTGGVAHFHVPCEGQPWTLWWFLWKTGLPTGDLKRKHAGHIQRFTYKGVMDKFYKHGFDIINIEYSVHMVGQVLDWLQWWATSLRRSLSPGGLTAAPNSTPQRGRSTTVKLVFGFYRWIVRLLEVSSYYETKLLKKIGLAMSVDMTVKKRYCHLGEGLKKIEIDDSPL